MDQDSAYYQMRPTFIIANTMPSQCFGIVMSVITDHCLTQKPISHINPDQIQQPQHRQQRLDQADRLPLCRQILWICSLPIDPSELEAFALASETDGEIQRDDSLQIRKGFKLPGKGSEATFFGTNVKGDWKLLFVSKASTFSTLSSTLFDEKNSGIPVSGIQ